ncbi:MAG: adenylate/guanylate cyclase domain-containing protein [Candidatus Cloacimonetes bacterium]|nr:adenylate/guanylate cyclase domain-containing protein [Candidatus Cloacimonadota bacterium]
MFDIDARNEVQQPSVELRDQTALADRDANSFLHKRLRGLGAGNQIRSIAPCFVNLGSASDLSAALRHIHILADRHHGYVNKIEYTDKGIVVLILFGVPLSDGRSLTQAVDFAVDAMEMMPKISIGISCGYAFAGWVGSDEVKEYTALGHPLNIAARLMHRQKREKLCVITTFGCKCTNLMISFICHRSSSKVWPSPFAIIGSCVAGSGIAISSSILSWAESVKWPS